MSAISANMRPTTRKATLRALGAKAGLVAPDETGATLDVRQLTKQPDWTQDTTWGGETPVDRFRDHRVREVDRG